MVVRDSIGPKIGCGRAVKDRLHSASTARLAGQVRLCACAAGQVHHPVFSNQSGVRLRDRL